jgi:heat shock protein HslJ
MNCKELAAALTFFCLAALPAAAQSTPPAGKWLAEDIGGGGVIDRVQTRLELSADGKVTGNGGCNRYFGTASVEGNRIVFGRIGSTRMACPPAVMSQETRFFNALTSVRTWRIERTKLLLLDSRGAVSIRLARNE